MCPFNSPTRHPPLTVMLTVDHLSCIEHHGGVDHLGLVEHLGDAEIIVGRVTTFQRARTSSEGPTSASGQGLLLMSRCLRAELDSRANGRLLNTCVHSQMPASVRYRAQPGPVVEAWGLSS